MLSVSKILVVALLAAPLMTLSGCCCAGLPGVGGLFGPSGPDIELPGEIAPEVEIPEFEELESEEPAFEEPEIEEPEGKPDLPPMGLPDIPVYPGARHDEGGDMPFWFRAMTGEYARFDWRVYTTPDPPGEVVSFYEKEMPARGWEGAVMGMGEEMEEAAAGAILTYSKGQDAEGEPEIVALIFVGSEGGETSIVIVRAEERG